MTDLQSKAITPVSRSVPTPVSIVELLQPTAPEHHINAGMKAWQEGERGGASHN